MAAVGRAQPRRMTETLAAAFSLPDVRKRIWFVLWVLVIYTFCLFIPLPGVDHDRLSEFFHAGAGGGGAGILDLLNAFSGGALKRVSVLSLGIMPYINASIIFQLLTIAVPQLEKMQREEGEYGRKKIAQWIRYLTVALAFFQGLGWTMVLRGWGVLQPGQLNLAMMIVTMAAGTCLLMWLGEELTEKGIGNGVSMIIFAGIMATLPGQMAATAQAVNTGGIRMGNVLLLTVLLVAMIILMIAVQQGQRRVKVQYAKRVVGTKMYGGASSFLPLKVNAAGVIPIIFAISVFLFPATVVNFVPIQAFSGGMQELVRRGASWLHDFQPSTSGWGLAAAAVYFGLVVIFTYFYTAVTFKPTEVADTMKKNGGYIPGIRPGRSTAEYLDWIMVRITLPGSIFLGVVALAQYYLPIMTKVNTFTMVGGTSLLIVVGVALEAMQQMEAHLLMRHYEGFIK